MASTGGLTRRRGAGGGGTTTEDGDRSDSPARGHHQRDSSAGAGETAFISENGHKIGRVFLWGGSEKRERLIGNITAFDPRDISENQERNKLPKLTLMEEILLLGLKDKQVCCSRCFSLVFEVGREC
jgi:Golgi phosphoprotein 3